MQDGQFVNTPFEDLLNAAGVHEPQAPAFDKFTGGGDIATVKPEQYFAAFQDQINSIPEKPLSTSSVVPVSPFQIDTSGRFPKQRIGLDNEDLYAQGQTWSEKATNGILKGLATAGTTFVQGTLGLVVGLADWAATGKFSKVFDNEFSQALNSFTQGLENTLPNYYTAKERAADWYETGNWFTTNFLFDKVIKNLGFSLGAVYSGAFTMKALKALRMAIPIAQDATALGKLGEYLESNLARVPQAERVGFASSAIRNTSKLVNAINPLIPSQRTLVSALGAFTESGLESLQNTNQYRDALIKDYQDKNGFRPEGGDLENINSEAEKVGKSSFMLNMVLLTATNYIQLPKILGSSYQTDRAVLNNITRKGVGGALESVVPAKGVGRLLFKGRNALGLLFSPTEAFEEASQNAIQVGTQSYYDKKRKGINTDVFDEAYGAYYDTFTTKQGMEQLIIGGLSGGLQQIRANVKERGVFGTGGERARSTSQAVAEMNAAGFGQALKSNVDHTRRSINIQSDKSEAVKAGDKLVADDLEFDDAHNYLSSRIKWGKYEFVQEDIEDYRNQATTPEGFDKLKEKGIVAEGESQGDFLDRLEKFERHAATVNSLFKSLNTRFGGQVLTDGEGKPILRDGKPLQKYSDATIEKMVYAAAKVANYDSRIQDTSDRLLSATAAGVDVQSVLDDIVNNDSLSAYTTEKAKIDAIKSIEKDDLSQALDDVVELSMRRKQLYGEYEDMKNNPQNYVEAAEKVAATTEAEKEIATHKIKTKDGEEDLQEGVEYQIVSTFKSKEGYKFFEFPTFKIIGKNADGTYAIEGSTGIKKNVSADFLNNYRVGKAADLQKNKKALYVKNNINKVAYFNFGKKRAAAILGVKENTLSNGNIKGRIWYNSKTDTIEFYYVDSKGKIRKIGLENKHFSKKYAKSKGYDRTQFNFGRELTKEEDDEMEDIEKQQASISEEWNKRLRIVRDLVEETSARIDTVNKQLEEKKAQLATVSEEFSSISAKIESSSPTRGGNFKRTTKAALKAAQRLSRLKDALEQEISDLENDKIELEQHLEYYFDLHQNISELPADREDFMEQIKEMRDNIGDAIANTGLAIIDANKLLTNVERALKDAMDLAFNLLAKFEAKYPGMPTNYRDIYSKLETLGKGTLFEENREALQPGIFEALRALEDELAALEDLDIVPGERSVKELKTAVDELYKELDALSKQQVIAAAIYDRFDSAFKALDEEERQRQAILKNEGALRKIYGNMSESGETYTGDPVGDDKKDRENDPFNASKSVANAASTTDPSGENGYAPKQDYHKRHEVFLNSYTFLPDDRRKNIRVVVVNSDIEKELGVNGLIDNVLSSAPQEIKDKKNDPVIGALVALYVEKDGDDYHILNEKAERIGKLGETGKDAEFINTAIYSTMSAAKTLDSKGKPRFVEGETPNVISVLDSYRSLRAKWMGSKSPAANTYQINVSSGIPRRIDGGTKVSPIGSVIEESDLSTPGIIQVSVNGTLDVNGVSKRYPIGRPVLIKNNSAVILNNRNVSKKEADNIYEAFHHLSSSVIGEKWNPAVVRYLRSVLFFSDPNSGTQKKSPGRNQFWVAGGSLHVGKNDGKNGFAIPFTPAAIEQNEALIKLVIQGAYISVNNSILKDARAFDEIIGWKDGIPQTRTWKSYQHYLLSPTYALDVALDESGENGKTREGEIPLSANIIKPQEGEMQGVFKQRYSTIIPKEDELQPAKPVIKAVVPVKVPTEKTDKLQGLLDKLNATGPTEELDALVKDVIDALGEAEYEKFQESIGNDELKAAIGEKVKGKSQDEAVRIVSKYLLTRFVEANIPKAPATVVSAPVVSANAPVQKDLDDIIAENQDGEDIDDALAHRLIDSYDVPRISEEDWSEFDKWMKKNLPNVPHKRVGSIIDMGKGNPGAWGVLHNGTIKIFQLAEKGTQYHEAFEAVWKYYVTSEERQSLHKEFTKRKGTFVERGTGNTIEYKNSTLQQAKEEMADEFFDYKESKKIPPRVDGQPRGILRFFVELWNFIKEWAKSVFYGPTEKLFNRINSGYYKKSQPIRDLRGREFSAINGTTEQLTREIMEDISANVIFTLLQDTNNNAFYNFGKIPVNELYDNVKEFTLSKLKNIIKSSDKLLKNPQSSANDKIKAERLIRAADEVKGIINSQWEDVKTKNKEFLRQVFKIKVSDEGTQLEEEQKNRNEYQRDNFFIDTKQSANTAVKLLFMTLVEAKKTGETIKSTGIPQPATNSFGGNKLVKSSKAFIDVMKDLAKTNTLAGMMAKLYDLSKKNPDYVRLYSRLNGNINERGQLNWDKLSFDDLRLLFDFYVTFAKQSPQPFILFYRENGEVVFQKADLNSLTNTTVEGWVSNLRMLAKGGNEYIKKGKIGKLTSYTISVPKDKIVYTGDVKTVLRDKLIPALGRLGVVIEPNMVGVISETEASKLKKAAEDFLSYIDVKNVTSISSKSLKVGGPLSAMAEIVINNSEVEDKMTYFNVENEQQQIYIDDNFFSKFSNSFNITPSLEAFKKEFPQYNDVFSANSLVLRKGGKFFDENGKRTGVKIENGYLNGIVTKRGPKKIAKFTKSERLLSYINSIINPSQSGWYPIMSAADSNTEHLMKLGRFFEYSETTSSTFNKKIRTTFGGYLQDEINLLVDLKNRNTSQNVDKQDTKLRFFEGILRDPLKTKIQALVKSDATITQVKDWVSDNISQVEEDVLKFLKDKGERIRNTLQSEGKIRMSEKADQFIISGIDSDFARERDNGFSVSSEEGEDTSVRMSTNQLDNFLIFAEANYAAATIEIHKLIFGDPYQFTIKDGGGGRVILDETKRVKQFESPRKSIASGKEINDKLNGLLNKVGELVLTPGDYGYTNFSDTLRTTTVGNFMVLGAPTLDGISGYEEVDRSDSQMWMMPVMHRETMIKSGSWSPEAEDFFQYDAAVFRQWWAGKNKAYGKTYTTALQKADDKLIKKGPPVGYSANIVKPIITGNKSNVDYIDFMVDKQSAFPMYFTNMLKDSHMIDLFIKNFQARIDYSIVPTGRKAGVGDVFYMYHGSEMNTDPISESHIFTIPITNFGIQLETKSGHEGDVTRGTQATKEVTLDLMEYGVPIDVTGNDKKGWHTLDEEEKESVSPLYREIKNNENLLNALTDLGYENLLSELSIVDKGTHFVVDNPKELEETLLREVFRKDANDNIIDSVRFNKDTNKFNISFEASSNYQSIKNILLSIVDRNVVSQKMNGGAKIQLSSALFDTDQTIKPYIKKNKKWEIVDDYFALSKAEQGNVKLFSTRLKFYSKNADGSIQRMQVLLPHWFSRKIRASKRFKNATDEEILAYLNETEEGKTILKGVGFRIPTQGTNFMDAFEVAGFLPQTAGDTIVLPAEITTKSGTDFDVDKLNVYLRNTYIDSDGRIRMIPSFGMGEKGFEEAKNFLRQGLWDEMIAISKKEQADLYMDVYEGEIGIGTQTPESLALSEKKGEKELNKIYRQSLENDYITSFENLLLYPGNFEKLIKPNSNNGMEKLRDEILDAIGKGEIEEANNVSALLSLNYINNQRQDTVQAKDLIGVGALGITHQSLTQKAQIVIDPARIKDTYIRDREFLGDGSIALKHNTYNGMPTISGIYDRAKQYISQKMSAYTNGFVDAVKDPFLSELGVSRETAGTFAFLERVGVPTKTVAYFMNQPIIREYLKMVYSGGSTYLFSKPNIEAAMGMFGNTVGESIDESSLLPNIQNYYKGNKFDTQKNAEQVFILTEFIKYSKMAAHLREFQQATNWDTANFSDFTHSMIKSLVYENAKAYNIFGDPAQILDSSFLGNIRNKILKSNTSLSAILRFQAPAIQQVLGRVLYPMINPRENYMSDRDVIKLGNGVVSSFIDYVVQTIHQDNNTNLNALIYKLLVDPTTNVSRQVQKIKNEKTNPLNSNYAFNRLGTLISDQDGEVDNITNKLTDKDPFSQNQFISALAEIREIDPALYKRIVLASILQSGVKKSPVSFTDLIPLEDYAAIVNPIMETLDKRGDFHWFAENNLYLRNNWDKKNGAVPQIPFKTKTKAGQWLPLNDIPYWHPKATAAIEAVTGKNLPLDLPITLLMNRKEANSDVITMSKPFPFIPGTNIGFTSQQIKEMSDRGDWGYKIVVGYQKVKDAGGNPLIISSQGKDGQIYFKYIYKPINLYGDGRFAQEYYNDTRPSVIDNGTYKVKAELNDSVIIDAFKNDVTFGVPEGFKQAQTFEEFKKSLEKKDCNA